MAMNYPSSHKEELKVQKRNPSVSVIIPAYNRGWILKETIDSVLAQDFTNFELIVVNDGSTDNTQDILNSYKEDIIVLQQNNKGVSAARNMGIASASGQLISFLDSDDLWLPKKLSIQVDFFNANPDALICQTEEIWVKDGIRVNHGKRHKKLSGNIFEPSLYLCLVSPSAVMIKCSLFEKAGMFDETLPACEDYDMWLRVSCRYPVYLIGIPLIIKRGGHSDQLSKSSCLDRYRIQSLKKIIESNLLTEKQKAAAIKAMQEKCTIYANGCLKRGRKEKALYYNDLAESFFLNP